MEQGEEEQQPQIPLTVMPPRVPQSPDEDFFKYRIYGGDILAQIEHQLKGEVLENGKYVEKFDRWANDEGINKVLHVVYACGINKGAYLGNLTKDEIMFKCRMLKKKLALLFFKKYQDFEIQKEMRDLLITTVVNSVHSGLSRSENGKEAEQLSVAAQRHEIYQKQEQQQQQHGRFKLPFLGGGRNT